ncbi:MAG: dipeptidase, partial [Candidatus Heimdallarchaeota archaeon]
MYIDTHLDTLWAMRKQNRVFNVESKNGHVDLPRAQKAGLLAGFFTGFPTDNHYTTERMLRKWLEFTTNQSNKLIKIENSLQLDLLLEERKQTNQQLDYKIGAILHFEGASGIDTELNRLYIYYNCGLRSMSVTWNEQNQFATGVGPDNDHTRGFTPEGLDLLSTMNDLGIIIDVSHLNDKSFWDVINHTNGPVIASHSNLRKFADHPRNITDEMVQAIADCGGTIGINFCKGFLSTKDTHKANHRCALEMIREVVDLTGTSSVNIGSDFDGCTLPEDMN